MNIADMINKKENKEELTYDELYQIVNACMNDTIQNHEISSLLSAIALNGMSEDEVINLIDIMLNSSNKMDYGQTITGKYSIGAIDDKTTLIVSSIVSACDVKFIGLSDSVINYLNTNGTSYSDQLDSMGLAINDRMRDITFIDKKIIPLCEDIGMKLPIPLLAANAMSKVLSAGINNAAIEIRTDINNTEEAYELANLIKKTGKKYNCNVVSFVTNGNITIGNSIGSILNIQEAIDILKGFGPNDMKLLLVKVSSYLVSAGKSISLEDATDLVIEKIIDGSAYEKFMEITNNVDDIKISDHVFSIKSSSTGFIKSINTLKLHELVYKISGGVDDTVGIILSKKEGDYVIENEELAKVYLNKIDLSIGKVLECFEITDIVGEVSPLINKII